MEGLAKEGNLYCKWALNDAMRILENRKNALNRLLLRNLLETQGERRIYNSSNQYAQRVALARMEGDTPVADATVNVAYESSGYVRDYFREEFGLNSLDNRGMPIISNVHYGVKYNNAYWDGDEMTYGDGDGKEFDNFAGAIDVVAHEMTHGLTQFLANLEYYGQSGALNEHFSDVFATIIKQRYLKQPPEEADWLIGDKVVTSNFPGTAIRSMKAPGTANKFDVQPDHMDRYYTGSSDNQGVHINSGIPNKAFYLSAIELGREAVALIWFETLRRLWRTAQFQDFLTQVMDVSTRLSEEGKVPAGSPEILADSLAAVGLKPLVA